MLTECFNPGCRKELLYLRNGRIVRIVRNHQDRVVVEHFWLCGDCYGTYDFRFSSQGSVGLVARSRKYEDEPGVRLDQIMVA
jgi:hypothetical protein